MESKQMSCYTQDSILVGSYYHTMMITPSVSSRLSTEHC